MYFWFIVCIAGAVRKARAGMREQDMWKGLGGQRTCGGDDKSLVTVGRIRDTAHAHWIIYQLIRTIQISVDD